MKMKKDSLVWLNSDRVVAGALVVVGGLALIVGWFGISGSALAVQQIPYLISGGFGGVMLIAIGCTLWISADLQDEWRQMEGVKERLDELVGERGVVDERVEERANAASRTNGKLEARQVGDKARS